MKPCAGNGRVGKGALFAPCPPSCDEVKKMVGTARRAPLPTLQLYDSANSSPARATSCRVVMTPPINISRLPRRYRVSAHHKAELDRHFAWFEAKLSPRPASFVRWLRRPSSWLVRIPLAILLVVGGVLSFLPILGLWM